jgi:hypothetical protein
MFYMPKTRYIDLEHLGCNYHLVSRRFQLVMMNDSKPKAELQSKDLNRSKFVNDSDQSKLLLGSYMSVLAYTLVELLLLSQPW